jgi:putative DNA primase/helicase
MSADAIPCFLEAMAAAGVHPVDPLAPMLARGGLVRFRADGDKPGRLNGWAVFYADKRPAGAFGHYRLGVREVWRADGPLVSRRGASADYVRQRVAKAACDLARHEAAREYVQLLWGASRPATRHPYAERKGLSLEGLRQQGGRLLVPMIDLATGERWNVQRIMPDGVRLFAKDARTAGLCWGRGAPGDVLALSEGMATAAAIHAATGLCSIAAMTAGNLEAVARAMRQRWPAATIIVGADLDPVGEAKAAGAARDVSGMIARPPYPSGAPPRGWDFDDALRAMGPDAVRAAFALPAQPIGN